MKKNILNMLFFGFALLYAGQAAAVHKLDFFAMPEAAMKNVKKVKTEWEEIYGDNMQQLQEKVLRATGYEGAAVFNAFIKPNLDSTIGNTTNSLYGQIESGHFDSDALLSNATGTFNQQIKNITSQVNSLNKDLDSAFASAATAAQALKDYDDAKIAARKSKEEEITKRLAELEAQQKDKYNQMDPDKVKEAAEEVASLTKQLEELRREDSTTDAEREKLVQKMNTQTASAANIQNQLNALTSESGVSQLVTDELKKFFTIKDEEADEEENEKLYANEIDSFFLAKYAYANSDTIAVIDKNRRKAYYEALQNLLRTGVQDISNSKVIEDTSRTYAGEDGQVTKVDGLYGGMSMRIGADIQNIKLAYRFTELLLAEIRYSAIQDIVKWNDKYKLRDYDKDVTEFNLDDYVLTDKEINQGFFGKAWSKGKSAAEKAISKWKGL